MNLGTGSMVSRLRKASTERLNEFKLFYDRGMDEVGGGLITPEVTESRHGKSNKKKPVKRFEVTMGGGVAIGQRRKSKRFSNFHQPTPWVRRLLAWRDLSRV